MRPAVLRPWGLLFGLTLFPLAAPAYLNGLFERNPYKPVSHYYSGSPDKTECEALKRQWDDYWNELQARHEPCLKEHQGTDVSSGPSCSYAACEPYHNVGSQDVPARTAIKNCFAAAKDIKEAEERQRRNMEEDNKNKQRAIEEATQRHQAELELQEKKRLDWRKPDPKQERKDRDREAEERRNKAEEERNKAEGRRSKVDKWYDKTLEEDRKSYYLDQQIHERDTQNFKQHAESASKNKETLFKEAREIFTAVKLPKAVDKRTIFALGKMTSGQSEEGLVDLSSAVGRTSLLKETQWSPYQIPFLFVGDITRATLKISDSIGRALSAQDIDRDWPALQAELDTAPLQYTEHIFSFENLMKNTAMQSAVPKIAGKMMLAMTPKTWQNAAGTLGQKVDFFYIVNEAGEKVYEKVSNSWIKSE